MSDSSVCSWDPFLLLGGLTQLDMNICAWSYWISLCCVQWISLEACSFLKWIRGKGDVDELGEMGDEEALGGETVEL